MRIEQLIGERNLSKKDLYCAIGLSRSGLDTMISGANAPKVDTVEKLADYFDVPMDFFFDRPKYSNANGQNNIEVDSKAKIESMQLLLDEKDKRIALLEEMVQIMRRH